MRLLAAALAFSCSRAGSGAERPRATASRSTRRSDLADTLRKGLNLARWQNDPQMTPSSCGACSTKRVREAREARRDRRLFLRAASRRRSTKASEPWMVRLTLEPGRAHARRGGRPPLQRARGPGPARRGDFQARARHLAAAPRPALPPGRLGRGQAPARCASCRSLALRRRAHRRQPRARSTRETHARVAAWSSSRAARRSASASCASAARRRYPDELVQNLSPVHPGDDYDRDKLVRLPAAPARERLLRQRAGRDRSQPRQPGRGAAARGGHRGAPSTTSRPAIELHHRRRLRRGAALHQPGLFDSAWRFRSTLRRGPERPRTCSSTSTRRRGRAALEQLPAAALPRDRTSRTRARARSRSASRATRARASRRARCVVLGELRGAERRAARRSPTRHAIYFGYRRSLPPDRRLRLAAPGLPRHVRGRRLARCARHASVRARHRRAPRSSSRRPRDGDLLLRGQVGG